MNSNQLKDLAMNIKRWGQELGFQQVGICDTDLSLEEPKLQEWLAKQYHGEMHWMARYGLMRARPHELLPGTLRVISVRMNYLPEQAAFAQTLQDPTKGYISRYALGRDYHKVLKNKLKQLGAKIQEYCLQETAINYRPFVDSAPIMERPLAVKAGLGWVGKHTLVLNKEAGSWFFLGELLIDLPLPVDNTPTEEQCGRCVACMTICPTGAIVEPYTIDAKRCISYLTIELEGVIPLHFRPLIGNRIYGCDDCQLICPWNRLAPTTNEQDFLPRKPLKNPDLLEIFAWDEKTFLKFTEGSAIRRIGYLRWLRNISIAMGNAPYQAAYVSALKKRYSLSPILDEHLAWAIEQQLLRKNQSGRDVLSLQKKRLINAIIKGLPRDA